MCRFLVYKSRTSKEAILISNLIVKPSHSILRQSYDCREREHADVSHGKMPSQINGDGFGFGWYLKDEYASDVTKDADAGFMGSPGGEKVKKMVL